MHMPLANNYFFVADYDSITVTMYDYTGKQQVKSFGVKTSGVSINHLFLKTRC